MKIHYFEIKRKIFHLSSLIFPLYYYFTSKHNAITLLTLLTCATIILDILRKYNTNIQYLLNKIFNKIMRPRELKNDLTGSSYMMMGFLITALIFDKDIVITSWIVLIVSDSLAAVIGSRYGKKIVYYGKSPMGSLAFFISSFLLTVFFIESAQLLVTLLTCLITTFFEFVEKKIKIDDNLIIPFVFCLSMTLLYGFF